ncbi:MAG: hypothetical protein JO270_15610 [Acidobacteriaceae bacterium]|nr:hypothetical protein [Acidobacteriaceae bacterium]MBV8572789.1 hypothetical protein [Acidobacteriaceae bacterium]
MPLLRPLDPAFPIARQLAIDVAPVVLMNLFTLDKADEQASSVAGSPHLFQKAGVRGICVT